MGEIAIGLLVGVILGWLAYRLWSGRGSEEALDRARQQAEEAAEQARKEAEAAARAQYEALTTEAERGDATRRRELAEREERLRKREDTLEKQDEALARRESTLTRREKDAGKRERRVERQEEEMKAANDEHKERLEAVAGLSQTEARSLLMDEVRGEAREKSIDQVRAIEKEALELAEERARLIVSAAVQRYASEHVADRTVSAVTLPSEDMKGRIIGREGRNIRAFEAATGCDVIIDDTPDGVVISCFNPVRREVGRLSMERLLQDGRVHPARIEEIVARTRKEIDQTVRQHGEAASLELEVAGLSPEVVKALGRLNYATSFAQNVLRHSVEVGALAGMMASELGLKPGPARRAGLLHDIGKAIEHDTEGSHAAAGATFLRKHGEKKNIIDAVAAHHGEVPQDSVLSQIVAAANALSASRPGARSESLAGYIKRLEDLEALASEFDGVERCYAIQAGREVRVMVDNARLSDRDADLLARDIAKRVEDELSYPGEVKVTVIRSTRAVQYAR